MNELNDEQLERIDQYLADELNATERAEVTSLIANNQTWKEAYDLRIAAGQVSKNVFHRSMRKKFTELDQATIPRRTIQPIWLAVAASLAILVSAVLWLFPTQDSNNLLAEYRTFPNIVLPIEKSGGEFTPREKIYQSYELGSYDQTITLFAQLDTVQTVDRLYLGLSYLESGNYHDAYTILDEVRASSNTRWSHVADWYQAWLLLKQDKTDEARAAFERIAKVPGHRYQTESEEVLAKLKSR